MYLSRPPISPPNTSKSPSVPLHQGKGNKTTVAVAENSVRHPTTQRFIQRHAEKLDPIRGASEVRRKGG